MTHRQLIAVLRLHSAPGHELPESELEPATMRQLTRSGLAEHKAYVQKWRLTPRGAEVARDAMGAARATMKLEARHG